VLRNDLWYVLLQLVLSIRTECYSSEKMRFEVFTVVTVRITGFWNVMLCNLLEICQHFRGVHCFHLQTALKKDAAGTCTRLVNFYHTTLCQIPEGKIILILKGCKVLYIYIYIYVCVCVCVHGDFEMHMMQS
jgi:hypothetical protein